MAPWQRSIRWVTPLPLLREQRIYAQLGMLGGFGILIRMKEDVGWSLARQTARRLARWRGGGARSGTKQPMLQPQLYNQIGGVMKKASIWTMACLLAATVFAQSNQKTDAQRDELAGPVKVVKTGKTTRSA